MSRRKKDPPPPTPPKQSPEAKFLTAVRLEHDNGKPTDERVEFALLSIKSAPDGTPPHPEVKVLGRFVLELAIELAAAERETQDALARLDKVLNRPA